MMRDVERELETMATAKPRAEFDARMSRLFVEAPTRREPIWAAKISLWQGACACILSLSFGFLLHAYVSKSPDSEVAKTVYVVPMDASLSEIFDGSAAARSATQFDHRAISNPASLQHHGNEL